MFYFPITTVAFIYLLGSSIVTIVLNLAVYNIHHRKENKTLTIKHAIFSIGSIVKYILLWLGFLVGKEVFSR